MTSFYREFLQQVNPIAETSDNLLVAADAKLNFDDNAAYRQKEIFALRDPTQEDPREVTKSRELNKLNWWSLLII